MKKTNLEKIEIAFLIMVCLGFAIMAVIFPLLLMGVPEGIARNMKIAGIIGGMIFVVAISAIAKIDLLWRSFITN